ncbi:ankyrin homolog [Plakobranchus ocellatus]|uniref:Ankyrin homolog n=1 Tax=Plakobranchus ocellatus TaxID=259542 RepID=A0AAV3XYG3_9GAST|nr:ankyrin homolog [Plakobranchus ocellatus]
MKAIDDLLNDHRKDEHKQISQDHLNAALLEACRAGWKFFVHKLVRSGATVCNEQNKNCTTALHIAAQHGFQDIVNFLLHKGADVNAVDENLNTALILAINPASCTEMLKMLLAHGAEVDAHNSEGMTALMKAVEVRDIDAITILIMARADENKRNRRGQTSEDIAMDSDISDIFEYIMHNKEAIVRSSFSYSPLMHYSNTSVRSSLFYSALRNAMLQNDIEVVKIFVDCVHTNRSLIARYDINHEQARSETLRELINSMCLNHGYEKKSYKVKLEIAKVLLANITHNHNWEFSFTLPLEMATRAGLYELVEILCKYKNFERHSGTFDHPALVIAAEKGLTDILKLLLSFTPVPIDSGHSRTSALFKAFVNNHIDCAEILLQKRKFSKKFLYEIARDLITQRLYKALDHLLFHLNDEEFTQSLLSQAVEHGRVETVQVLINRGADVNARHDGGKVALVLALERLEGPGLFEMVKLLVESGARVNRSLPDKSPLVCAVYKSPEIVKYLLEKGAHVNEVGDEMGNTPLMAAITRSISRYVFDSFDRIDCFHDCIVALQMPNVVSKLLDAGADPNIVNSKGDTALNVAVTWHSLDVVSKLLDAGADLEVRNSDGLTPLLLATTRGQENMIVLLERYGANTAALDNDGNTALLLVLQRSTAPEEETLRLLAQGKDVINKQGIYGLTPLMLALQNYNCDVIKILLDLGADPNLVNNTFEEGRTALSFALDCIDVPSAVPCAEVLIKHTGLASVPRRCYRSLLKVIEKDERQMVQLMVTRGMAPFCVDINRTDETDLILNVNDSLKESLSPLATALSFGRLAIAQYLVNNWFLTPVDVVGSPFLRELRNELGRSSRAASLSFMDEHLSQPMSLVKLSFVAVSAALGEPAGREERVRNTPLPAILRDKLLFRHEIFSMDMY